MQRTTLGDTGEQIPAIGFGGMPLSIQGRPPQEEGRRVLNAAIDAGMTFIDTADVYCYDDGDIGHNERLIASVVRERKDEVKVATKAASAARKARGRTTARPSTSAKRVRKASARSAPIASGSISSTRPIRASRSRNRSKHSRSCNAPASFCTSV
jgi:aryl-alcohol dehydrogenase-like predicted oxidoreductase